MESLEPVVRDAVEKKRAPFGGMVLGGSRRLGLDTRSSNADFRYTVTKKPKG